MKLPTHGLLGYFLARVFRWEGVRFRCVVAGAMAPDCPVIAAGIVAAATTLLETGSLEFVKFKAQMDLFYFFGWTLRSSHNLLHGPLSLALLAALAATHLDAERRAPVLAFLAGAASHAAADILTHVDDGPLLFWPLDWETRLAGPISHWDLDHGGLIVTICECCAWVCALLKVSPNPLPDLRLGRLWRSAGYPPVASMAAPRK